MDRRNFLTAGVVGSSVLEVLLGRAGVKALAFVGADTSFHAYFLWGCATAIYRIESAVDKGGRDKTI